jgi:hypothetical protein
VPGVPLPASPVAGALSPEGDYDLYSFPLQAGRTARFTVSGVAGFEFDLSVYAPGTTSIETAWPVAMEYSDGFAQTSLTYLAPTTGVYYLLVYPEAGSGAYAIAHDVDVTPPVTTVVGADDRWHRTAVTLTFAAGDDASGVAYVESSLDGGTWSKGFTRLVGGNGARTVAYRAVDAAGNTEATRQVTVNVDAGRPKPVALANATVKKGEKATLRFRVDDITPRATCKIKVYKGARLVKTLKVGAVTTNSSTSYRWICKLARGKYTWKLSATDLAGNHELNPGVRRLTVK